jgi:DNA mismatch endonuclease (patch repair protein)
MSDVVDPATRSRMMSRIRSRNTKPELILRKRLHREGFRFSLHGAHLPGRPDVFFPRRKVAILVHGCFWHQHPGCHWCTAPASNIEFWQTKFFQNRKRDAVELASLNEAGWRVATVWECGLKPAFIDPTIAEVINWVRSDTRTFDSGITRARKGT